MGLELEAWTDAGRVRGSVSRAVAARDVVEMGPLVEIERASVAALGPPGMLVSGRSMGSLTLDLDEFLVIGEPDDAAAPVHAQWHAIRATVGPYVLEGELPTLPGFDPGRAIARPSGTFVHLRDVRIARAEAPDVVLARLPGALVNRYAVDSVDADILLVHFFPGAATHLDPGRAGVSA